MFENNAELKDFYKLEEGTGNPKIKGLLIDVYRLKGVNEIEFEDNLENLYKLCDCRLIDVAERKVGDNWYDFVVDDEGLFRDNWIPSVFDGEQKPMLAGCALILNHDDEGNFTSLTDAQIEDLKKRCVPLMIDEAEKTHFLSVLLGAEYE